MAVENPQSIGDIDQQIQYQQRSQTWDWAIVGGQYS